MLQWIRMIMNVLLIDYFFGKQGTVFHWLFSSCSTSCHEKWHPFDQV